MAVSPSRADHATAQKALLVAGASGVAVGVAAVSGSLATATYFARKVLTPEVASGRREALQRALEDVRNSKPSVTRDNLPVDIGRSAIMALRRIASPDDLTAAAGLLSDRYPDLADLLRRAGKRA